MLYKRSQKFWQKIKIITTLFKLKSVWSRNKYSIQRFHAKFAKNSQRMTWQSAIKCIKWDFSEKLRKLPKEPWKRLTFLGMYPILLLAAVFGMKNCEICFEDKPIDKFATLKNCNHDVFCLECVGKHSIALVGHQEIKTCPKCRRIIVAVNNEAFQDFQWKQRIERKWIDRMIWRIHRTYP